MPKLTKRAKVPPDTAHKICLFIRNGNAIDVAAQCAGIHRDTFYEWMKRGRKGVEGYTDFVEAVDLATATAEALKVAVVHAAAASGKHWQAAAWWLERRRHQRWGRIDRLEHSGPDGRPIAIDVTKMSDEELVELAKTGLVARGEPSPEPDVEIVEVPTDPS